MIIHKASCTLALAAVLLSHQPALAETTLRIAMTASDIPTATGLPNNGFEGMRFLGYPIFEGLVLWDLTRTDQLATLRPGLAEKWEQEPSDNKTSRTGIFISRDAPFGTRFSVDPNRAVSAVGGLVKGKVTIAILPFAGRPAQ